MHPHHLREAIANTPRVAVYGTLKQGFNNAHWLNGATLLGSDVTKALTLYDMAKALDKSMTISGVQLIEKSGGKSGDFRRVPG